MERLRPYPLSVFCALTLFIWGNRIWLAWTDDEDTVAEKLVWSTPITVFVVVAAVVLVALLRGTSPTERWLQLGARVFASGTIAYWAVRAPMILAADHPGPFKVVHAVLAVASVVAAAVALRSLGRIGGADPGRGGSDAATGDRPGQLIGGS